ncbi:hypothetical protein COY27_06750 [Candidatus Woesearchaeota archaeon CG_4_10_14_0_2_um_filter_33_13]|nr:MAG: hypothetical protein COY27_06750 [Candidatus Woesearchaeota archaeon CG_4_10_14_0_2_um_filter_33_13]
MRKLMVLLVMLSLVILAVGCSKEVIPNEELPAANIDQAQEKIEEIINDPIVEESVITEISTEQQITPTEVVVEEPISETSLLPSETTHTIQIVTKGFDPKEITIKKGDTIKWNVIRSGNLNKAQISGSQQCVSIKSPLLKTGESFSWKFDKVETCTIIDVITTTQIMKVHVEE